ncbi:DUF4097 family beta strand repeat-containing protein [Opitutus terrae]|uniref:DUF4097 domain-containing protein n=1 Tax=Opitutus terrae (strain DSM 11246 / JCM 15787 / PB90-1) TaxID=452637 RepID=B1ZX04_OPITP|nr:DUF4097 family beta strand repeat-containing protein [Opitutus terrae]ACB75115.1 conserved hypothetical protein [Opitutus terrae PB90-1]
MHLRLFALLASTLLVAASVRADSYSFKEPFTKSGPFSPTGTLTVHNINGKITVRTWDKQEIQIEGEKSAKTEEELQMIDLTIDVSESRADLKVKLPKRKDGWFGGNTIRAAVSFTITVPATATLESVSTVNSSVDIENVQGPVHAESVNGNVHASNLGSSAKLETVNGSIRADFTAVPAGQELDFETVNGGVKVRLPADAGFKLRASVVNGHVDCDFPIQLSSRGRRSLHGTVGDGRASVKAESVNGSISIEKR